MKRLLVLVGGLLMGTLLMGCGSDPREGLVNAALDEIEDAATKMASIKNNIKKAIDNTETGKSPNFKEALDEVEALKKKATQLKELKIKSDAVKDKITDDERKELTDSVRGRVKNAVEQVAKAKKDLIDTIAAYEAEHKDALKAVREKLAEADGEFEAISRR